VLRFHYWSVSVSRYSSVSEVVDYDLGPRGSILSTTSRSALGSQSTRALKLQRQYKEADTHRALLWLKCMELHHLCH
jgi:hypothetical protein